MDEKQQLLELYKEFIYTKENFVSRSFATNKFYIIALTLCLFILAGLTEYGPATGPLTDPAGSVMVVAVALAGMIFSLLLWANQDAYSYLLRLKFNYVIDKMEEQLCFQPCIKEKEAIKEQAKKKRNYVFADVQKTFALASMAIFLAAFLWNLIPMILSAWMPIV